VLYIFTPFIFTGIHTFKIGFFSSSNSVGVINTADGLWGLLRNPL